MIKVTREQMFAYWYLRALRGAQEFSRTHPMPDATLTTRPSVFITQSRILRFIAQMEVRARHALTSDEPDKKYLL